jgi:transposase
MVTEAELESKMASLREHCDPKLYDEFLSNFKDEHLSLQNNHLDLQKEKLELESQNSGLEEAKNDLLISKEVLECELESYKHNYQLLRQALFGKKSETIEINSAQMSLVFDEAEILSEIDGESSNEDDYIENGSSESLPLSGAGGTEAKKGRKAISKDLAREEIIHELKALDLECDCGSPLTHIGEDTSEELHYVPAKVIVRKHIRYKYACKDCQEVVRRAPAPDRPLDKAMVTSSLLADMLTKKFQDHLPLYRQSQIWERYGIKLSRMTLSKWFLSCASKLSPLKEVMKEDLKSLDYVCSDETTLNVLKEEQATNYMWLHMSGERKNRAIIYEYQASRSGKPTSEFLSSFNGYHQCDGYSGYNALHNRDSVIGVGCMAHSRRKFMSIVKIAKKSGIAQKVVNIMSGLYKIEKQIAPLSCDKIREERQKRSKPILEKLKEILLAYRDKAPPSSSLGKAINYTLNQWEKLIVYLDNGKLRIDNNDCERAIKPFVIGRKNWMFSQSIEGAQGSAIIYSIIETCKANKINAYDYLRYILDNIKSAKDTHELRAMLPYNIDPELLKSI